MDIHIRSEGREDPGITPNTYGRAYIKVNGHDHSMHGRGHNVVVVDATTGNVTTKCTVFPYFVIFYFQSSLFLQHSTALHREKKRINNNNNNNNNNSDDNFLCMGI